MFYFLKGHTILVVMHEIQKPLMDMGIFEKGKSKLLSRFVQSVLENWESVLPD